MAFLTSSEFRVYWAGLHDWPIGQSFQQNNGVKGLWLVLDGEIVVKTEAQEWRLGPNTAMIYSWDGPREISTPKGARWLSLVMRATAYDSVNLLDLFEPPRVWQPTPRRRQMLERWMRELIRQWKNPAAPDSINPETMRLYNTLSHQPRGADTELICQSLAGAIFGLCWQSCELGDLSQAVQQHAPGWLSTVLEKIHDDLSVEISELAASVGWSDSQFRHNFQERMGVSPQDYLTRQRLQAARHLLETTDLPIRAIAAQIGIASTSHFIRLWRRTYETTPARHRSANRNAQI